MGKYDEVSPERVRAEVARFAERVLRMDAEGVLLSSVPEVLKQLGDLRQMLFAYEVRCTARLATRTNPDREPEDPLVRQSRRIVDEARRRHRELEEELEGGPRPDDPGDE